jgi:predicted transposase/invertase (TIGR01784 family)
MNSSDNQQDSWNSEIDFSDLMDLRIDFAFKLLFTKGDPRLLISLLNAIFSNKRIPRVIKSLTIKNPYLEKESSNDKLSILDIRAELADMTAVLIEMHMYGLGDLKAKTIRSWARAFSEELEAGDDYRQPPTITITFANGKVKPIEYVNEEKDKIHRLCMIMDREDFTVFTDAMELHYIDMKAFAKAVNEAGSISINDTEDVMFNKWVSIITQKEITDKAIIRDVCKGEEEIQVAISNLARYGEDKITRQAYQRRLDEIYFYNKNIADYKQQIEQAQRMAEQEQRRAEQAEAEFQQEQRRAEQAEAENKKLRQELAELMMKRSNHPQPQG